MTTKTTQFSLARYARSELQRTKQPQCQAIRLLLHNFLKDLRKSRVKKGAYKWVYDQQEANIRINLVEGIFKHPDSRLPFELLNWQKVYFSLLYGWIEKKTYKKEGVQQIRRYRRAYIQLAKKNGKTTTLAIQAILHLLEGRNNNLCASFATKKEQASILMEQARNIVHASPELSDVLSYKNQTLLRADKNNRYKALTGNADKEEGQIFSMVIGDEFHVYKDNKMINMVTQSMSNQPNGLLVLITTPGLSVPCPAYNYYLNASHALEKNNRDYERSLFMIFEVDQADDPMNQKIWYKANPTLKERGFMDNLETLKQELSSNSADQRAFNAKVLGRWSEAGQEDFITVKQWNLRHVKHKAGYTNITDWVMQNTGKIYLYVGLDFSQKDDLTAMGLLYHVPTTGEMVFRVQHFAPAITIKSSAMLKRPDYNPFVATGEVIPCGQDTIKKAEVIGNMTYHHEHAPIKKAVVDDYGGSSIMPILQHYVGEEDCYKAGKKHYNSIARVKSLVIDNNNFYQDTGELMEWEIGNVSMRYDSYNNPHINKVDQERKIDGVMSLLYCADGIDRDNIAMATNRDEEAEMRYAATIKLPEPPQEAPKEEAKIKVFQNN